MQRRKQVNPLTQFCKQNELGKLSEDACYIDRRDHDSRKPFSLQTYHYHPYGQRLQATCYPGQFYNDGHVSGSNVDEESKVTRFPGFEMTHPRVVQDMPMLPVQMPRIRGWFDADTESNLREEISYNKKPCVNAGERSFIPYSFQEFSHLCYDPQEPQYIIPEDTHNKCFDNARFYHWGGEDTRHDRQEKYRGGCNYQVKYFPANLSYSNFGY